MTFPTFKAVWIKPYSKLEDSVEEKGTSSFLDIDNAEQVGISQGRKKKQAYGAYLVLSLNIKHTEDYDLHVGDICLVEEAAVQTYEWEGETCYFVNSPQYIPFTLVR